jgi:hypothetical protein
MAISERNTARVERDTAIAERHIARAEHDVAQHNLEAWLDAYRRANAIQQADLQAAESLLMDALREREDAQTQTRRFQADLRRLQDRHEHLRDASQRRATKSGRYRTERDEQRRNRTNLEADLGMYRARDEERQVHGAAGEKMGWHDRDGVRPEKRVVGEWAELRIIP